MDNLPKESLQGKIYAFLVSRINEGMPPTIREIGLAMGIESTGHIDHCLKMLEKKGLITRQQGKSRGIRLTQPAGIPIIGAIAAGLPLDIFPDSADMHECLPVHQQFQTGNMFALIVRGQSMIEDHICDGDYIVAYPQQTCQNGDIVVATHIRAGVSGSATLKRFFQERDQVRLQPANEEMEPILIPKSEWDMEWMIQGKVIAIFRQCHLA